LKNINLESEELSLIKVFCKMNCFKPIMRNQIKTKIAKIVENSNVILKKFGPNSIFESPYSSKFVFKDSSIQISICSGYTFFVITSKISILLKKS